MFKTRQRLVKKKTSFAFFEILSCFEYTKKKHLLTHQLINRLNNQKMLQQHLSGKTTRNFVHQALFFFVCSKQESISKKKSEFFFFTNFCLVLNIHFVFSFPGVGGISSEKKLQFDDRDIVILSKSFSRRMI